MSRIAQRRDDKFIVAASYDGLQLAGPFDSKAKAFDAQDKLVSAVVRQTTDHGVILVDEDANDAFVAGPFKDVRQAEAERLKIAKAGRGKTKADPAPAPEEADEPPAEDAPPATEPEKPADEPKPAASGGKSGGKTKAA